MYQGITLNPQVVRFEDLVFEDVTAVEVDRTAARVAEDWTDLGPHAGFVDVPEVRTVVRITRRLAPEGPGAVPGPLPGRLGELTFYTSPTWSSAGQKRIRIRAVVTQVIHRLRPPTGSPARAQPTPEQIITLIGESTNGALDPVTIDDPPIAA